MGIEDIQWEYNSTHDGGKYTYGNMTQTMMGIEDIQWEYNSNHNGNGRYTMGI